MTILERVKIRLGIAAEEVKHDALLLIQVGDAESFFKDYCKRSDIPASAQSIVEQLVVSIHNSHGGIQSEKIGDTSFSYFEDTISGDLKRQLNRYRKTLVQ